MASFNKVILMGNLTRDPELNHTPSGTAVCEVGLAVNRKFKRGDDMVDETTFVDVTLWGRRAEIAGEYLQKGSPAHIEGRLQLDQWDDRESGQKRSKLKVVAESLQLIGGGRGGGNGGGRQQQPAPQQSPGGGSQGEIPGMNDNDVPF